MDGSIGLPSAYQKKNGERLPDFWGTEALLKENWDENPL